MNVDELRRQLEIDEGVVHEIYLDHLGYATFGIGHLVRDDDPNMDGKLVPRWKSLDALKPSNQISKQSCLTAPNYIQTLTICRKKLNK